MFDNLLQHMSDMIYTNMWLAPILAFLTGIIASLSPCALSSIPLIIGYVEAGREKSTKKSLLYSLIFALGLCLTFTLLGVIAGTAGSFFGNYHSLWFIFLGILMIIMSLQMSDFITLIHIDLMSFNKKRGAVGAFILGILSGIFSTPCSTPILIALLSIIGGMGNLYYGIMLMFFYSLGYSMITILAGTFIGFVNHLKGIKKYGAVSSILKYILSILIFLLGIYMLYEGL